jgi:hypothetical protein
VEGFGGGVGEVTRRELEEANSGGIRRRIWWRDLVEENGGGIGGRIGRRRGECLGDTTIEFSPTQHFGNVRSVVMMHTCVEKSMSARNRVRDLRSMSTGRVPSRWLPLNHPPHHPTIHPHLGWAHRVGPRVLVNS